MFRLQLKSKLRRTKFWLHLFFAYSQRYKLWLSAFILIIIILFYLSYKILPYLIKANTISIGYVGTYTLETIPTQILSLATQSLISTQHDGKPVPSLASHWTISQDGKDYLVFLKDNLTWHDGTAVDAKDISIAISNVQITALNNKAIEFKLPNPVSSFPQALDKPVFKAKSFYGTGKFRIVNIQQTTNNIVKRIQLVPKDKNLPNVDIRFYPTEEQTIEALKIGERATNMARVFNIREGFSRKDDTLPERIFQGLQNGPLKGIPYPREEFTQALTVLYNLKGWDAVTGQPSRERLEALSLGWAADLMDVLQAKTRRDPFGEDGLAGAELPDQKYNLVALEIFGQLASQGESLLFGICRIDFFFMFQALHGQPSLIQRRPFCR